MGKIVQLGYSILRFFADYAAKKWPLSGQQKLGVKEPEEFAAAPKHVVAGEQRCQTDHPSDVLQASLAATPV